MIRFNDNKYIKDEVTDTVVIVDIITQDISILNSTAKFIFDRLLEQKSIEKTINEFIQSNIIDLDTTSYDTIANDFMKIEATLYEKEVIVNE